MSTATQPSSSHRRRLQFRLQTMLAAMLLVCLGLTFWSVYIRPYRQEARIIARLQEHGAEVTTETEGPVWLRALVGDEFFRRIVKAELHEPQTMEEDVRVLTGAPRLRSLLLSHPPENSLRYLPAMRALRDLHCISGDEVAIKQWDLVSDETLRHNRQVHAIANSNRLWRLHRRRIGGA